MIPAQKYWDKIKFIEVYVPNLTQMPVWHKISKLRSAEGHAEREVEAVWKQTLAEDRS